jgi:hypothetical protein
MSWPLASHFSAMLQNPRVAFREPRLQRAVVEKNGQNQPRPWAGAFAVVYKATDTDSGEPFALRVFTTESPERRERYDLISGYLKDRKLRCLVDFEYRDGAIRSAGDGKWYPLIVMDWVQGDTLFQWLQARAAEGNGEAIAQLADRWLEAVQELADAELAHGDLQHANIMVTPAGEIKLVDYDGMCVPALVGRRNLEVGIEPYQHPARNATTLLSLDLDNFSALMIYTVLRALALQPGLWLKHIQQPGYDRLLFRQEDLLAPAQSALGYDLAALPDADFQALLGKLLSLAQGRIEAVPPLAQLVNSYAQVERLLAARQWDAAVDLLNRRGHFRDAPAALQPLIQQAYEHVCRQKAWGKFAKIPAEISEPVDRQLVEAWNEPVFAGFALAEPQRQRVIEARRRVQILDRLRHLVQRTAGKLTLEEEKGLAGLAARLPPDYAHGLRRRTELARRRLLAYAQLERELAAPTSEAAIVEAWQGLVQAKGEPLVSIEWGIRIGLAEERAAIFRALSAIPRRAPLDERDQRVLEAWNQQIMAGCPEADKWRPLQQMALVRQEVLKRLQAAIESQDDLAIVQWGKKRCLAKYPLPEAWAATIAEASDRLDRAEALLAAIRQEVAAGEAGQDGQLAGKAPGLHSGDGGSGAPSPETAEPAAQAPEAPPPAAADALDEPLPSDLEGEEPPAPRSLLPASPSEPLPSDLEGEEAAVAAEGDLEPAPSSAAGTPGTRVPGEAGWEPPPAVPAVSPSPLRDAFDVRLLRAYPDRFAPYQEFLSDWIRRELVPREKLGLTLLEEVPGVAPAERPEGYYRLHWAWPEERLADRCVVAVLAAEPATADEPEGLEARWRGQISAEEWENAGQVRLIRGESGWGGSVVVVWAIIDAGFAHFHSSPLVLGRIASRWRLGAWVKGLGSRRRDANPKPSPTPATPEPEDPEQQS